jgi:anthranilate/para-aminobenzoate synthase component II
MEDTIKGITDWEGLVNKPLLTSDGTEVGIISAVQPEKLVVSHGPITPDKYIIPKSSIKMFKDGVVYIHENFKAVDKNYKFE